MRRVKNTVSSQSAGSTLPVDWRESNFKLGMAVVLSVGAVLTFTVEHTFDDIQDASVTPTWFDTDGLTGLTTNDEGNIIIPVSAVRLNVTSHTSGEATITLLQAGGR